MLTWRRPVLTAACVMCVIALIGAGRSSGAPARSSGAFELVVKDAKPLKAGTTRIRSRSAVASRVHGLVPGNADGAGGYEHHAFPHAYSAHWVRLRASEQCKATAHFVYN